MSIKEEIIELNQTKEGIKTVLEEKGVDLQGKRFSDTPGLIEEMSVGKGDEVEAYAIGDAKTAQENDKVILNYSADMLPGEANVTNTPTQLEYNPYGLIYIDRKSAYFGNYNGLGNRLGYFSRGYDWTYNYTSPTNQYTNSGTITRVVLPYGLVGTSGEDKCYILNGATVTDYSTYGGFRNEMAGTQSRDYTYATFGTRDNTYIFKLTDGSYSLFTGAPIDATRTSVGVLMDGGVHKLVIIKSNQTVETYSIGTDGTTTLLGTTQHTLSIGEGVNMWRPIGNSHVIARTGTSSGNVSGVFGFSYSFNDGLCSVVKDETLTSFLQQQIMIHGLTTVNNILVTDDNIVYGWGVEGMFAFEYDESGEQIKYNVPFPFPDTSYSPQIFINPVDKVAIKRMSATEVYVRYLDAPISQSYVATTAGEGLQFQSVSLTGFVKENNDGILTVSTVLDPNAVVPAYPDKYGLDVTVHPGHGPQSGVTWEQPVLLSNGNMYDSNFAVEATDELGGWPAYAPFSNGAIEAWASSRTDPSTSNPIYYEIWSTDPIKIQTIVMKNRSSYATEMLGDFVLQGTNEWYNSDSWVDLATFQNRNTTASADVTFDVNATEFYTSYRFVITSTADGSTSKRVSIGQLTITAQANLVLDEGTIDVSWGWAKSGDEYIKYDGHVPSVYGLSSGQVEGERATTMGLYLTKFESGAVFPLLSITPPSPDMSETEPYESEHLGINKFTMSLSQWGADFPYFNNVYIQSIILKPTDVSQVGEIYLKVFKKDNYDTCVACSEVGTVEGNDLKFTFLDKIPIQPSDIFRFAISTDNSINWTGVTPINMNVVRVTSNNYDFWGSWATTPLSNNDATPAIPQFSIELYQTRISYYLQDVYLSNDLTYIVAEPEPVTPSFEPDDDSTANAGSIKGTFSASVSYVGERPGKTAGTTWYYYKMPFEDIPTHPYIFQFMGALPKDDNYRWVKYSAYQYNPDAASSDTTNKIGNYELVGNTGSLPTTTSIIGVNQGNTNMLSYKTTNYPTIEGVMLITSTKLPDSVNLVWYVKEITEITNSAELSQSSQSGELYGSWYIKIRNESGQVTGTKTVYILHQPL